MPRELTEKERKELALLKASNAMFEKTKEECRILNKPKAIKLIEGAQNELMEEAEQFGISTNIDDINNASYTKPQKDNNVIKRDFYNIKKEQETNTNTIDAPKNSIINNQNVNISYTDDFDENTQYDVLPLPSNGEAYPNKSSRIAVAYLTASDENFITSPNLYRDGTILDVLLKRKIVDKSINPDLLCKGDRDAIILWLRATGYGNEFPITVKDPKTGIEFDSMVDLSTIKAKPFNLKGDDNGYFTYFTTLTKDEIKFKFLNRKDEKELISMQNIDNLNSSRNVLDNAIKDIKDQLEISDLSNNDKIKLLSNISAIENWRDSIPNYSDIGENRSLTNSMELSIVSINGNDDRNFIKKYVRNMPALEAFKFRKYLSDNEPSMDFSIMVERPQSLGGGSFKTFLELDISLFLNIAKL